MPLRRLEKGLDRPERAGAPVLLYTINVDWYFLSHRLPIAMAARDAGMDVWVASAETGCRAQIEAAGLNFIPVALSRKSLNPLKELGVVLQLIRIYRRLRPAIVHQVTLKPIVYGTFASLLTPGCNVVNAIAGQGAALGGASSLPGRFLTRAVAIAIRSGKGVTIFQNASDRERFIEQHRFPPGRACLIAGSGVDCDVFRVTPFPAGPPVVLMACRLLWPKGVREFVEAARLVRAERPDVRFVLVGAPDDDSSKSVDRETLERWVKHGDVEWWGQQHDMPATLSQATIVALPTYYGEGVPKVLIEAAACARPIITTRTPGCTDIVEHERNGLLIDPRNSRQLADAITHLLASPSTQSRFGDEGRKMVESSFRVEKVVTETLDVYQRVTAEYPVTRTKR